jgi:hypothetical protein
MPARTGNPARIQASARVVSPRRRRAIFPALGSPCRQTLGQEQVTRMDHYPPPADNNRRREIRKAAFRRPIVDESQYETWDG